MYWPKVSMKGRNVSLVHSPVSTGGAVYSPVSRMLSTRNWCASLGLGTKISNAVRFFASTVRLPASLPKGPARMPMNSMGEAATDFRVSSWRRVPLSPAFRSRCPVTQFFTPSAPGLSARRATDRAFAPRLVTSISMVVKDEASQAPADGSRVSPGQSSSGVEAIRSVLPSPTAS